MTKEQHEQLQDLIHKVQRIVHYAGEAYIPYELAAAISRADEAQGECYQFIEALRPVDPTSEKQP
jgi:hypothetical protein